MGLKKLIDLDLLDRFLDKVKELIPSKYADSPSAGGPATYTNAIHYATVDSTSTSTVFTVTIPGITEYYDGLTVLLKNGVITSAKNFTVNINGLGAKGVYSNMAAATRETTIFNVNYTLLLIYDSTRVNGGCWINYRGYYSDANSIGYQLRTNSSTLPMDSIVYRYRLLFSNVDGTKWVPANNSTSTNATASRTTIQTPIDPFGEIVYYGTTDSVAAGSNPSASYLWQQYAISLGYSFNRTGAALVLQYPKPVYLKCAPQADGSAIIDADNPYVQALPSSADGKIYIYLGIAYSETNIELKMKHPVYYHDGSSIRLWPGADYITGMTILSYGNSTWDDFIKAYNSNKVVYCKASSNLNPASGAQGRMAFLAYVNNPGDPTSVEFQYYRSVSSHTDSQQGDQVYVYSLSKTSGWSVTVRESYTKIVAGTGLSGTYNSGVLTIANTAGLPSVTASDDGKFLRVSNGAWAAETILSANGVSF